MIELTAVSKSYGAFRAVRDLTFSVSSGEIIGLVGPNGAGKTTTMKMITGYLVPTEGRVRVDGAIVADDPTTVQRSIGYLPEHNPLYPDMSVRDYLLFVGRMRDLTGSNLKDRFAQVVGACHLEDKVGATIQTLSKGYKQRVGIAQAMIHDPKILILDEPTSGLDPNQIVDIRSLIGQLGQDKTVILSTHILSEVEETCSRALMIVGGKLAVDGSIDKLSGVGAHRFTVDAKEEVVIELLTNMDKVDDAECIASQDGKHTYQVNVPNGEDIAAELYRLARDKDWTLTELSRDRRNLEDVFREASQGTGELS